MISGPEETTVFGSFVFWSSASTSLSTHGNRNMIRLKVILHLNLRDYEFISYLSCGMLAHS